MCFVDIEKVFDGVPRKLMGWAVRKKCSPEVIVRAVLSLDHGAKTKVKVRSELSEKFLMQVGVHKYLCYCHCFLQLWWMQSWRMQEKN